MTSKDPVSGSVVGGKYRLERALARGGMGSVWAGRHLGLDSPVAVKFMMPSAAEAVSSRARFAREAKAAASLRSPHVVQVLDYDATGDAPYIVMELLEGEDLGQRLHRCGRLGLPEVASIVRQLAKGLVLAHEAGIVHRDLKPGNVFLAKVGAEEVVKVLDFGVAKETRVDATDAQTTTTGVVVGSPSYMSPEQARGGDIDTRSDLWSLGVVVFQAVTGQRPFDGANLADVLVRICSDPVPRATRVLPDLPFEIDGFFDRALCRSPDGRFQDARTLADALTAIALGEDAPVSRSPGSLGPRAEATGAVEAFAEPTRPTVIKRMDSLVATAGVTPPRSSPPGAAEISAEAPLLSSLSATGAVSVAVRPARSAHADSSTPTAEASQPARSAKGRGIGWAIGGAAAVAALWAASQVGVFGGSKATNAVAADGPGTAVSEAALPAASDKAEPTVAPVVSMGDATGPTSVVESQPTATPSQSVAMPTPPTPGRLPPRPRATAAPTVDPKFGLPVGHP
jgi:serine/threonine-protein kinase